MPRAPPQSRPSLKTWYTVGDLLVGTENELAPYPSRDPTVYEVISVRDKTATVRERRLVHIPTDAPVPAHPNALRRAKYEVEPGFVPESKAKPARPVWMSTSPDTAPRALNVNGSHGRSTWLTIAKVQLPLDLTSNEKFQFASMDPPTFYAIPTVMDW